MKRLLVGVLVACASSGAFAETYFWSPGNTWGQFSVVDNWMVGAAAASSTKATQLPGSGDSLATYTGANYALDLGGGSYTVKEWLQGGTRSGNHAFAVTNGTLTFSGNLTTHSCDTITIWDGGTIVVKGDYYQGVWDAPSSKMTVKSGGTFEPQGQFSLYGQKLVVEAGGVAKLAPTKFIYVGNTAQTGTMANAGTLSFPAGLVIDPNSSVTRDDNPGPAGLSVTQTAGLIELGGDVTLSGTRSTLSVAVSGGKVLATGDVVVDPQVDFSVSAGVEIEVDEDCVFDAAGIVTYPADGACVKSGAGFLGVNSEKSAAMAIDVTAGGILLAQVGEYDLSGFTFGAGTSLRVCAGVETSVPAGVDQVSIVFDADAFKLGQKLFASQDAGWLAKAKAAADGQFSGVGLVVQDGMALYLYPNPDENCFDASKASSLDDPAGWGGTLPLAGADVVVCGDLATPELDEVVMGDCPAFRSITLTRGAALRVEGSADLPQMSLVGKSGILFAAGSDAYLTNGFSSAAEAEALPIFEVRTNATVHLPQRVYERTKADIYFNVPSQCCDATDCFKFKNVDLRLYGTIKLPDAWKDWNPSFGAPGAYEIHYLSRVTFGYAEPGETTYFAMTADGGCVEVFDTSYQGCGNYSSIHVVNPAPGGTVKVLRPIVLHDFVKRTTNKHDANAGFLIGFNNPVSEPFTVIATGDTVLDPSAGSGIGGGAEVILRDRAQIARAACRADDWTLTFGFTFADEGRLVMEDDSYFGFPHVLDTETRFGRNVLVDSSAENVIALRSGRIMAHEMWRSKGVPGEAFVSNGVWEVDKRYPACVGSVGFVYTNTPVFNGFSSVRIASGGCLTLRGTDNLAAFTRWLSDKGLSGFDFQWNRLAFLNVPVTGEGGLFVTNALPDAVAQYSTTLIVGSAANTATGAASACPVSATGARAYLRFQDGANWAGTVVANGGVSLVNTNATAETGLPATATFAAMRFDGPFPIRLWKGATVTNDFLEITGDSVQTNPKAGLAGVGMGGYAPVAGEFFTVGRCPKSATPPPAARNWEVRLEDDPSDSAKWLVRLAYSPSGLTVILR